MSVIEKQYWTEGIEEGKKLERERIIKLLETLGCSVNGIEHNCDNALGYTTAKELIALIEDETRNIRSKILPDGSILIEEIKEESKFLDKEEN